jgi:hypothetical protein
MHCTYYHYYVDRHKSSSIGKDLLGLVVNRSTCLKKFFKFIKKSLMLSVVREKNLPNLDSSLEVSLYVRKPHLNSTKWSLKNEGYYTF